MIFGGFQHNVLRRVAKTGGQPGLASRRPQWLCWGCQRNGASHAVPVGMAASRRDLPAGAVASPLDAGDQSGRQVRDAVEPIELPAGAVEVELGDAGVSQRAEAGRVGDRLKHLAE